MAFVASVASCDHVSHGRVAAAGAESGSMRWSVPLLFAMLAVSQRAEASPCDCGDDVAPRPAGVRLELRALAAPFSHAGLEGDYLGVAIGAAYAWERVTVSAALPAWRLALGADTVTGLGDASLGVRMRLWSPTERLSLGAELAAHLPTGDDDESLGMGHVMAMPSVWAHWQLAPAWQLAAQAGWARAIAHAPLMESGGHAHHASGPLVDPMNFSELGAGVAAAWSARPWLAFAASGSYAAPIETHGEARGIVGVGARVQAGGGVEVGLEGQVPVVGEPFGARAIATVGAAF
jgi:hypothetical protein